MATKYFPAELKEKYRGSVSHQNNCFIYIFSNVASKPLEVELNTTCLPLDSVLKEKYRGIQSSIYNIHVPCCRRFYYLQQQDHSRSKK